MSESPILIDFWTFSRGYGLISDTIEPSISIRYKWDYTYSFREIFQGLCLFKELRLFQTLESLSNPSKKNLRYECSKMGN